MSYDDENDVEVIGVIVDPYSLDDNDWYEVIEIAKKYVDSGETNIYKASVMAFFDFLGEAEQTKTH